MFKLKRDRSKLVSLCNVWEHIEEWDLDPENNRVLIVSSGEVEKSTSTRVRLETRLLIEIISPGRGSQSPCSSRRIYERLLSSSPCERRDGWVCRKSGMIRLVVWEWGAYCGSVCVSEPGADINGLGGRWPRTCAILHSEGSVRVVTGK